MLAQELLSIADLFPKIIALRDRINDLEQQLGEHPDKSCNHTLVAASEHLAQLIDKIGVSQVPPRHEIRTLASELRSRLDLLTFKRQEASLHTWRAQHIRFQQQFFKVRILNSYYASTTGFFH